MSLSFRLFPLASAYQPQVAVESIAAPSRDLSPTSWLFASNNSTEQSNLLQQGVAAYQQGNFSGAENFWSQAAADFQQQGSWLNYALALNYLSLAAQQLGNLEKATNYINQSEQFLPKATEGNIAFVQAKILNTKGRLQLLQGSGELALATWQQAEAIYKQLDDKEAIAGVQINQAQALQVLGQYRQAIKNLEATEKNIQNKTDYSIQAMRVLSIANILQSVGDLESSWCTLKDGLSKSQLSSYPVIANNLLLSFANTTKALGDKLKERLTLKYKEKYIETQRHITQDGNKFVDCQTKSIDTLEIYLYQKAKDLYEQIINDELASTVTKMQANSNYINLILENGSRFDKKYLDTIEQYIKKLSPSRTAVFARINLANILNKAEQKFGYSYSIELLLKEAVNEARSLEDLKAESYALGYLGKFYEENHQWSQAKIATNQALNIAASIKSFDIAYQWQWQIGRILKNQDEPDISKAISTYIEAVNTANSLRPNLLGIDFKLSENNLNYVNSSSQFYFRDNLEPIYRELIDLILSENDTPKQETLYRAIGIMEMLQIAEIENFLGCDLSNQQISKAKSIAEAEQLVVNTLTKIHYQDPTAAIIYPIILDKKISVILSLPNQKLRYDSSPVSKKELEKTLTILNQVKSEKNLNDDQSFKKYSNKLYKWLLENFEQDLEINSIKTLVFILDDRLRNLPMTVLWDGTKYLLYKDYATALIPSLQLVNLQSKRTNEEINTLFAGLSKEPTSEETKKIAGAGSSLEQTISQFNRIKQELPLTLALFNEDFTTTKIQEKLQTSFFRIVHLASHGQFSSSPEQTYVLEWNKRINVNELRALLKSTEPAAKTIQLLVLSACQTATGDKHAALGLAGVAVRSGAESTLATLWNISADNNIIELLGNFYKNFKDTKNPISIAKALQEAQKNVFENSESEKEPYFWAPYVLVGNWL